MLNISKKTSRYSLACRKKSAGFTLIELLLVVGIISILSVVAFASLNPAQRFMDVRNVRRANDVKALLDAINIYTAENKGKYPDGLRSSMLETQLGTLDFGCAVSTGGCNVTEDTCLDLSAPLAKYLKHIPIDPGSIYSPANTGYSVVVDSNGIVTIRACGTEGSTNIFAPR